MNEGLRGWFKRRRGSRAITELREHALKVVDTSVELDKAIAFVIANKRLDAEKALERLMMREKEADVIERHLFEELSKGELPPKEREDLMHLVKRVDMVADWTKESGRCLDIMMSSEIGVPIEIWEMVREMSKGLVNCCKAMERTIDSFAKEKDDVIQHKMEVERLEHEIDDLYLETIKKLILADIDLRGVIILKDFLLAGENAVDYCDHSVDMIEALVVAQR